ncbi:MAG: peptidase BlaR1 [Flavipsychrobacter sp.]|jgi:beta-lactamase regulating signal transducer with metallopeptidase domain|nr:peptidase BlaR1 [Flavipsychrobacter sp.]
MSTLLSHSLAWALLYSFWQGLLLYGLLFILLKAMPNISSRVKYNLAMGSFAALFIWFADTWFAQFQKLKGAIVYITSPSLSSGGESINTVTTVIAPQSDTSLLYRLLPGMHQYYPFIILLYSLGLTFMLFRFMVNIGRLRALRTQGIALPAQNWADFVAKWHARFNISRPVQLFLSNRISVPMMMGAMKPIILLPVATINHLSTEQVEAILLHELAHIRRHDYLLNILQTIGETLLFFNPFVWLISSIIRKEREHCCDDLVVESAADPLPYARALAILESNRQENNLALGATGNKNQLFNRIKRIMEMKKSNLTNSQLTIIIVAILAITFSVAMFTFTPSFAQKAKKEKQAANSGDTSSPKKVVKYKTIVIDDNGEVVTENIHGPEEPAKGKNSKVIVKYIRDNESGKHGDDHTYTRTYEYTTDSADVQKIIKEVLIDTKDVAEDVALALANVHKELKDVDWQEIYKDIDKALAEVDKQIKDPKLRKQVKEEIEKEMEIARKEMKEARKEMGDAKREMEIAQKARKQHKKIIVVDNADDKSYGYNSSNFDHMIDEMEQDKLIDKSTVFVLRKAGNELFINGKKQPNTVYEKYSKYLNYKTVDIKGKKGTLNIHIND